MALTLIGFARKFAKHAARLKVGRRVCEAIKPAGIVGKGIWIPAFAGMTESGGKVVSAEMTGFGGKTVSAEMAGFGGN